VWSNRAKNINRKEVKKHECQYMSRRVDYGVQEKPMRKGS